MRKDVLARPGISGGWRSVIIITWSAVFACVLAVAVSSRTIGRPVWWLGPTSSPAPVFFMAVPVVLVFAPLAAAFRFPSRSVAVSFLCSVGLLLSALPDAGDRPAIAIAIATVGVAALLSTVGVMTGQRQYR